MTNGFDKKIRPSEELSHSLILLGHFNPNPP